MNIRLATALLFCLFAIASVAIADEPNELVQLIVKLLSEKDKDLRSVALEQVRTEAKGEAATKLFAAELPKLQPEAQAGLLSALADRGDAAARPAVLELLSKSSDEPVRIAAIESLGALGEVGDLPLVVKSLVAESKLEKVAARKSLVRLRGDQVPPAIVLAINGADTPVRIALVEILVTRRALDTIPDLLKLAIDADPAVRAAAMTALGQLASPEHISGMLAGVLKAEKGTERDAAERAVALVCGRIDEPAGRAILLLGKMDKFDPANRLVLLSIMGRVGGPAALTAVETAIASSDAAKHEAGIRALYNWPDASTSARLIELSEKDEHPEHRKLALAALIRVAPLPDKRSDSEKLALLQEVHSMCTSDEDRNQVIKRARAIRTVETLRFLVPYLDQPTFAQMACESIVELAHHRTLRDANKPEFHQALDKVIATSKDEVVILRANRYKNNQTWAKPTVAE